MYLLIDVPLEDEVKIYLASIAGLSCPRRRLQALLDGIGEVFRLLLCLDRLPWCS
jgi:hypothetical protein